jgi:hypothetical protein
MISDRRTDESLQEYAIRRAWQLGHFWNPANPNGMNVKQSDLKNLNIRDQVAIDAFRSLAMSDVGNYARHVFEKHGRPPQFDGQFGPALQAMIEDPAGRCPVPDYAPPKGVVFAFDDPSLQQVVEQMQIRGIQAALGNGNWQSCHSIGNAHCATVMVNPARMPEFLKPLFKTVLTRVQKAYADVGLLFRFLDQSKKDILTGEVFDTNINIDMSWESSSSGWIGLAIVGTGETCGGRIWCKFLNTYKGGSTDEAIISQQTSLLKHELGHNCGFGHANGWVMNPSIVNNLPPEWHPSDPTTLKLKRAFSGVPVPVPGSAPNPNPDPIPQPPADRVQEQLDAIRLQNIIQDAQLKWLIGQVNSLKK